MNDHFRIFIGVDLVLSMVFVMGMNISRAKQVIKDYPNARELMQKFNECRDAGKNLVFTLVQSL